MYRQFLFIIASVQPFRVGVHFDGDEYLPQGNSDFTTTEGEAIKGEIEDFPGGIIGTFIKLLY